MLWATRRLKVERCRDSRPGDETNVVGGDKPARPHPRSRHCVTL